MTETKSVDYQCVFIESHDGTGECYQCGQSRKAHNRTSVQTRRQAMLQARRGRKALDNAPDWFGCGRTITNESWQRFLTARAKYYASKDAEKALCQPAFISIGKSNLNGAILYITTHLTQMHIINIDSRERLTVESGIGQWLIWNRVEPVGTAKLGSGLL